MAHCSDAGVAFAAIAAQWGGVAVAWIFNLWGTADLLNAFYRANHAGVLTGQLGATYFIPTVVVPLPSPRRFKPSLAKRRHLRVREDGKRRARITQNIARNWYGGEGGIRSVACRALHSLARACSEAENKTLTGITVLAHVYRSFLKANSA